MTGLLDDGLLDDSLIDDGLLHGSLLDDDLQPCKSLLDNNPLHDNWLTMRQLLQYT